MCASVQQSAVDVQSARPVMPFAFLSEFDRADMSSPARLCAETPSPRRNCVFVHEASPVIPNVRGTRIFQAASSIALPV